jgi:hypothetical protein
MTARHLHLLPPQGGSVKASPVLRFPAKYRSLMRGILRREIARLETAVPMEEWMVDDEEGWITLRFEREP